MNILQGMNRWICENEGIVYIVYAITVFSLVTAFVRSWGEGRMAEKEKQYFSVYQSLMKQHYEALKTQIDLTRKLRHDIANHLYTLEQLGESGREKEVQEYRAYLEEQYAKLKQTGYCKNMLADAIICQKVKLCRGKGISFHVHLEGLDIESLEEMDCMQLLFGLIDYGINTLEKGRMPEKNLSLIAKREMGYTILEFQMETVGKKRGGRQAELREVRDIAERYEGFMKESYDSDMGRTTVQVAVRAA